MKKQFLSDSGLTELIGYIKTYITSKITWGNVTGKPTTFPPENHSHDDRYFTETEINTKLAGKANSSHKHTKAEITDFPTSMPASDVPTWAKQASKPAYTKSEVGLGSVDNTADKDKEVKYASSSGSAGTASSVDWSGVKNKPSTFTPTTHSHGAGDITSVNASAIVGTIGLDHLPAGALERCKIVANDTARFKLTTSDVQNGDVVKVGTDANAKMYFVVDETKLSSEAGYTVFSAGTAASVPWSGVTGKPSAYPPERHTHDDRYYTESEVDSKLSGKSNTTHNHDDRYYTESEMDTKLSGKSDSGHSHNYAGSNSVGGAANSANKLNNLGRIRSADDLDNFIEGSVFKYGTVADIDGLDGLAKNDGIILCAPWEADSYGHQIFLDDNGYTIAHRFRANGTWSTWKTLIDTSNISSQSVNYATTASSCTGNAATATNASKVNNHTVNSDVPSNAKFTDTVYSHPTYTAKSSGLYKVTVDSTGHVSAATAVTKADITGLGIPGSDTNTWRPLGTTGDTACAGNDSRLSNARPASDVSAWAKASSKPSYTKSEVGLGNVDNTADSAKSVKYATSAGSATTAETCTGNSATTTSIVDYGDTSAKINIGYAGSGISGDAIKYLAGYTTGTKGATMNIKDVSKDALKSWLGLGSLAYSSATIPTIPSSLPANGGNASTVNGHTVNSDVPAGAKFTDTNTWRGIQDNLTSTSTSDSLSANQGKVLKGLIDGKSNSGHTHSTATTNASGFMSSTDKIELVTLASGMDAYFTQEEINTIFA